MWAAAAVDLFEIVNLAVEPQTEFQKVLGRVREEMIGDRAGRGAHRPHGEHGPRPD